MSLKTPEAIEVEALPIEVKAIPLYADIVSMNQKVSSMINTSSSGNIVIEVLNFTSFCSPIILPASILMFTVYSNIINKGVLYLVFILCIICIRVVFLSKLTMKSTCMNSYPLFSNKNVTLSTYIISFTFFYLCLPMFYNTSINIGIMAFLIFYFIYDFVTKYLMRCFDSQDYLLYVLGDFIAGSFMGIIISSSLFYWGGQNLLLLTETQSNKVSCSRPSKQQFLCKVKKNGEVIGSTTV